MSGRGKYALLLLALVTSMLLPLTSVMSPLKREGVVVAENLGFGSQEEAMKALEEAMELASPETRACLSCHSNPKVVKSVGVVYDWLRSEHAWNTPDEIVELYKKIGYSEVRLADKFKNYNYTVGCYECHGMSAEPDRPDRVDHFGYKIATIVSLKDCSQCHYKEAAEISWTWHGFGALNSWLKPWYSKIVKYAKEHNKTDTMLPQVYDKIGKDIITWDWYMEYARKLLEGKLDDPEVKEFGTPYDQNFKNIVSALYPASGMLTHEVRDNFTATYAGEEYSSIMEHPDYKNAYLYFACMACHGSIVIPYKKEANRVKLWGWPNMGAGRIDPDGSIGTCTSCHTRHTFSIEEVRKPYTCGQCHLGPDHPYIEVFEESKHGNIYDAEGEKWDWEAIPWRVGVDFRGPTCATCHMSTIADAEGKILVSGSHDLRKRLVWDLMHAFSWPKPKYPDHVQNAIIKGVNPPLGFGSAISVEGYEVVKEQAEDQLGFPKFKTKYTGELAKRRSEMKSVCKSCHASQWVDNYFAIYDQNIIDYNVTANYAKQLLNRAYELGIHDKSNPLDEYMELMWYYIWHHDGRRWRAGAAMMGPDYTMWLGIVDTVMDKLGRMVSYFETAVQIKKIEKELAEAKEPAEIKELKTKLEELRERLASMEAEIPKLKDTLESRISEVKSESVEEAKSAVKKDISEIQSTLSNVETKISILSESSDRAMEAASGARDTAALATLVGAIGLALAVIAIVSIVVVRKS